MKKILAKLMRWGTREDLSATRFRTDQKDQADLARDRLKQIMESRKEKYISEETVERKPPTEAEITGPSDSKEV